MFIYFFWVMFMQCFPLLCILFIQVRANSEIDNHPAWKFIPTDVCGVTRYVHNSGRIINGKNAKLGQFPWIARLGFQNFFTRRIKFNCAGTLITEIHVITAGHCGSSHDVVRLGEHDTTTKFDCTEDDICTTYQDINIKKYIFNKFDKEKLNHDICLILLEKPAKFNDFVKPACLPRGTLLDLDLIGIHAHIAGWGYTNSTLETEATTLQYISVPIVDSSKCDKIYVHQLTEYQCCAGYPKGKDSCNGDSGGPMTKSFKVDNVKRCYLIGVVSYGRSDCGAGPAVYTLICKYMLTILDNIKE
ncbi:unnamed protein product [Psylliodes chrysocephalus]|uniref:Peptidase S1 domain-containing protein n=1 Tax=Psylliodes chrysocephalus TaxID=3402493 RepID=A0A9P0D135_9CUCU|nr:unnamed protein product [Psylliodes chrysocephala]